MYPEDRVLVGVINRKRDFDMAQTQHWYRVPQGQAAQGIYAEYIALFFSRAFGELNGAIHYYARRTGLELARRRDLLPDELAHPRADALYHKLQFGELRRKDPPIVNGDRRVVTFIHTTWDRFSQARDLSDLYSDADTFVDRVFHALEGQGVRAERRWDAGTRAGNVGATLVIRCAEGMVIASTGSHDERAIALPMCEGPDALRATVAAILDEVRKHGGLPASRRR